MRIRHYNRTLEQDIFLGIVNPIDLESNLDESQNEKRENTESGETINNCGLEFCVKEMHIRIT